MGWNGDWQNSLSLRADVIIIGHVAPARANGLPRTSSFFEAAKEHPLLLRQESTMVAT
jgi:hypothetical protein